MCQMSYRPRSNWVDGNANSHYWDFFILIDKARITSGVANLDQLIELCCKHSKIKLSMFDDSLKAITIDRIKNGLGPRIRFMKLLATMKEKNYDLVMKIVDRDFKIYKPDNKNMRLIIPSSSTHVDEGTITITSCSPTITRFCLPKPIEVVQETLLLPSVQQATWISAPGPQFFGELKTNLKSNFQLEKSSEFVQVLKSLNDPTENLVIKMPTKRALMFFHPKEEPPDRRKFLSDLFKRKFEKSLKFRRRKSYKLHGGYFKPP